MKLTTLLLFMNFIHISATVYSQNERFTFKTDKIQIRELLDKIESESKYKFLYRSEYLNTTSSINLDAKNLSLEELLSVALVKTDITFKVLDDNLVVIVPKELAAALQQLKITGKVTDANTGEQLPGVSIIVVGTSIGTISDINGNYSIEVPNKDAVLEFSFVGYIGEKIAVSNQTVIDAKLTVDVKKLDEIVVVGYGTQKKSSLTGSVTSVNTEEMKKYASHDISQVLQGRATGVSVTSDGEAGATPSVRIRGFSTFGNAEPLYVVDGVPVTSIRDFNPNDVESISVLKDASAGAIYGSVAANGVVLITTKHGKKNTALKIEYSGYYGVDKIWQKMPVTQRVDFQMLQNEMMTNGGYPLVPTNNPASATYNKSIDTDWQKEALKTGIHQNHNLNLSGGNVNSTYNISMDYYHSDGTLVGNGPLYDRYSVRVNSETERGIFKFGESVYYTHSHQDGLTASSNFLSGGRPPMIGDIVIAQPTMAIYDATRLGGFGGTALDGSEGVSLNVIGMNSLIKNKTDVDRVLANVYTEVKILEGLKYKINLSYDKTFCRDFVFEPTFNLGYFFLNETTSTLNDNSRIYTTGLVENTLTYNKIFGKHNLNLLVGQMYQKSSTLNRGGYSEKLPEPYYPVLNNGTNKTSSGSYYENALFSYLGRINYEYGDRYLITATLRRDGSSRFAPSNRYGIFPSIAAAWKLHNERIFKLPSFISALKLRASYGQLGNQNIGDYLYSSAINQNILYNFNGVKVVGSSQTKLVSQTIRWETTTSGNIGFDAGFLNNAFELTVEYYNKKTTDILVDVPVPMTTGGNNRPTVNAGSLRNRGIETSITYHKSSGKFHFDISANASTLNNKVLALGQTTPIDGVGSRTEVGRSIGEFYGYVTEGIFQTTDEITKHAVQALNTAPGDFKFKNLNDDNQITDKDRTYLGNAIPNLYYGLNFDARYKNFDFTLSASGSTGNKILSRQYTELMHTTNYMNYSTDMLNRWTPTNPTNDYPRLCQGDPNENGRMSDRKDWLQDGTYLRINTLSFGYTLPKNYLIKYISSARVYATCQNLYTFQYYKGFNPDFTSGVWNPGFDNGSFPKSRTTMLGIQLAF